MRRLGGKDEQIGLELIRRSGNRDTNSSRFARLWLFQLFFASSDNRSSRAK